MILQGNLKKQMFFSAKLCQLAKPIYRLENLGELQFIFSKTGIFYVLQAARISFSLQILSLGLEIQLF